MKIAHVVCTFPPYKGGMGNSTYNFAKTLGGMDYQVTVFTPNYDWRIFSRQTEKEKHFKVVRLLPLFSYGNAAVLPQLLWRLRGFDIVHLHYPFYGSMAFVLLRKYLVGKKMKLVLHYHMDSVGKGFKGLIFRINRRYILPRLIKKAKAVTCSSIDYAKNSALTKYYEIYKNKFRKISFGVDLNKFKQIECGPEAENKQRKEKNILFVGGLDKAHYFKGLENLIKAINLLQSDQEINKKYDFNIKLQVIGDGNMKPYYQGLVGDLKLDKLVKFYNHIGDKELVRYYNRCHVFVLPSINQGESFGLVLLEAMACCRPVIASNLPGVRSVFKNGREGLLIRPNDINDLAARLKFILINDRLARKMGLAGRRLVEKKYTWQKIGKDLDMVYHQVNYTPI